MAKRNLLKLYSGHIISLTFVIFTFTGCADHYFPASVGATPQPVYITSNIEPPSDTFISTEYNRAFSWSEGDKNELTKFNFARNISYKYCIIQYDATLFQGQYTVTGIPEYNGSYDYYGLNTAGRFALKLPSENLHIAYGFAVEFNFEHGEYEEFRHAAADAGFITTQPGTIQACVNNFIGIYGIGKNNNFIAVQANLGLPGIGSANIMYFMEDVGFWVSYSGISNNNGINDIEQYYIFSMGMGLRL